jgi:hypothetical protein
MDVRRKFILRISAAIAGLLAVLQLASERAEINAFEVNYIVYTHVFAVSTTSHAHDMSRTLACDAVKLGSFATFESRELRSCYSS